MYLPNGLIIESIHNLTNNRTPQLISDEAVVFYEGISSFKIGDISNWNSDRFDFISHKDLMNRLKEKGIIMKTESIIETTKLRDLILK